MTSYEQYFIGVFGLTAMHFGLGANARLRRWAPIIGLCGQPFWAVHAAKTGAFGIAVLVAAYTLVYINGGLVQWTGRSLRERARRLLSEEAARQGLLLLAVLLVGLTALLAYIACVLRELR